jgi:ATPase subunit of ABC transporter with duplicated ATPase domains
MSNVSPGWKLRVLLAQALFSNPDILLLDEPTNNLDINTIRWLENVLNGYQSTMIIISHDRHFLNQVCTHMADVDYGEIRIYAGNYDDYMLASTQARERLVSNNAKAKERVAELQDFVRRFAANKSKSRQATSRLKQIDRIKADQVVVKPSSRQNPYIRFEQNKVMHRLAVTVENLTKAYDAPVITKFSAMVDAGEKIAIIGANGVGKTTLLRLLQGLEAPMSGAVSRGANVRLGYYAQESENMDPAATALEVCRSGGADETWVRTILGCLRLKADHVERPIGTMSAGERGKVALARLLLSGVNVLMLDEPTNHLDMESIESLQLALEKFEGTLFVVSHDRQFIDALATRVLIVAGDGKVTDWRGGYEEYLDSLGVN